ncbi:MAG: glycosyltransferase [Rhodopirellula sp.]|nr:glycosyltransferase [Rhodopirellula sp.]
MSAAVKKILEIIPSLDRCGAEKQMMLLAAGLPRDEFDTHVCVLTRSGPLQAELEKAGIPVTLIGKRWRADPQAYLRLRRWIGKLRPDLVHTWLFAANAYGRAAALAQGIDRLIAAERCVDPWKGGLEFTVDRYLARRTQRIVTNSVAVRDFYVEHGLPSEKFAVIPNGIDPPPAVSTTREQALDELGLPRNARLVGFIGRLWPQKRVKDAIWAADLLKVIRDDVHLLIFGDGPQRERLLRYRDQVEIRDKVHLLGQRDDVARFLPHFDVLWSTSEYEGQSNAIMEAMGNAVPVVATDIPGTRDLVVHEVTGYLVPLGDRAAFARQTNILLGDKSLAERLGGAGRDRMRNAFSVTGMVQRYADLYREVLG